MASSRRKTPSQDAGPAQPSWRQAPTRSRKEVRRMQSSTAIAARPASKPATISRSSGRSGLRLPSKSMMREILRRILVLALAAGLTYGMIELVRMPQLTVTATSTLIGGAQRITPEQVYIASGIEGRNIFLVRPASVAAVIGEIGGVERAQVHVRLPNQVLIDVWEHAPLVAWQGITTTLWLAADGALVPQTGLTPPLTLIDQTGRLPDPGSPLGSALLENLGILRAQRPDISELYYAKNQGLYFRTAEGCEVWLGDSSPLDGKLALLEIARQEITRLGQQARVIDLRFSNQRAIWW